MGFLRSMRDATKHRRLRPPNDGKKFPLPSHLEPLETDKGQRIARAARIDPKLVEALPTQEHPAFCGIAAAINVTQAVRPADSVRQKQFASVFQAGKWPQVFAHYGWGFMDSWPSSVKFHLLRHLQYDGVPLSLLAAWFRAQGYRAGEIRADGSSEDRFRQNVISAFKDVPVAGDQWHETVGRERPLGNYILVNYSRKKIGQRIFSGGHYAVIGGYHNKFDMVLLLEVNSWRYPSVWAPLCKVWDAIETQVGNGSWRGYILVATPQPEEAPEAE